MKNKQLNQLLEICKANNLNPKNLIEFNQAIKIYKDDTNKNNIRSTNKRTFKSV